MKCSICDGERVGLPHVNLDAESRALCRRCVVDYYDDLMAAGAHSINPDWYELSFGIEANVEAIDKVRADRDARTMAKVKQADVKADAGLLESIANSTADAVRNAILQMTDVQSHTITITFGEAATVVSVKPK